MRRRLRRLRYILGHDVPWWFLHRFHPKHKYHVLRTGLAPGWVDTDELLTHLVVKLFIDFIEQEKPFEGFDLEESLDSEEWFRVKELYEFFKATDYTSLEYEELTEKLNEVIRLREFFWT